MVKRCRPGVSGILVEIHLSPFKYSIPRTCIPSASIYVSYIALAYALTLSHDPPLIQTNGGPSPSSRGRLSGMTHLMSSLRVSVRLIMREISVSAEH